MTLEELDSYIFEAINLLMNCKNPPNNNAVSQ